MFALSKNDNKRVYSILWNALLDGSLNDVKNRATRDFTSLTVAAYKGHLDVVKFFVQSKVGIDQADKFGCTALYTASEKGVVTYLVQSGASLDIAKQNGGTPLIIASIKGHLEVVKFFVQNGADINQKDKQVFSGMDALQHAKKHNKMKW